MAPRRGGEAVDRLVQLCYSDLDVDALHREMLVRLRKVMSVDAAFFGTVDPATLLFTAAYPDDALAVAAPQFLANELGGRDVNHFTQLADLPGHVRTLDAATRRERGASQRYREVMAPLDLGDELRAALVCDGVCWGVLCLHREQAEAGFSDDEARLLRRLVPHLARALRRGLLRTPASPPGSARPGVVLVGPDGAVLSRTAEADHWLDAIGDDFGRLDSALPAAVHAVVGQHVHAPTDAPPREMVLRTRTGEWISITASLLHGAGPPAVAVVLGPAPPRQITSRLLAAHGLTPAQQRVTELVLRGRSTRQIVEALHLSEYTVQEHLRAAFDKAGVNSRRELMAALIMH